MQQPKQLSSFILPMWAPVLVLACASACSDDVGTTNPINCKSLHESNCPEEGETGGDDASDESDESGESGDLDATIEPCALEDDGHDRTVHQCNGWLSASIQFKTLLGNCGQTLGDPGWCEEDHEFGMGFDSEAMPAVMACCDPETAAEDDILESCASDVLEQVCRSIPARLEKLLDEDVIKVKRRQARALTRWLNAHQQECFDALRPLAYDEPGVLEARSWKINDGNNEDWPALEDFTIHFEGATVTNASAPFDPSDHQVCRGTDFNNGEVFEQEGPLSPGINQVLAMAEAQGEAKVTGRMTPAVTGSATLATRSDCVAPSCPTASVTTDAHGNLTLEELEFYAAGPAVLTDGEARVEVERAALRLYGVSHGTRLEVGSLDTYEIPAERALFVISGDSGFAVDIRLARNATPLRLRKVGEGWVLDPFAIEHLRGDDGDAIPEVWRLTLPVTTWK